MGARYIYDLNKDELETYLVSIGGQKYRAAQIFSALGVGKDFEKINIPKELKEKISADFYTSLPKVVQKYVSRDGTLKFLLELRDKELVETVLLKQDYGNTVCVSSQVGCAMGCKFCASGADGLVRNLSAGEMLAQVLLVAASSAESNSAANVAALSNRSMIGTHQSLHVVIMGSGEPFDNFDNTIKFLRLLSCSGGINIGARNISISTSGIVPKIREFADLKLQVNLCISLHAPNDTIRRSIMPVANAYLIADLIPAAKYFFEKTKRRVIFEYSLIDGVNCEVRHAEELAKLLRGFPAHVNLINLNPVAFQPKNDLEAGDIQGKKALHPPSRAVGLKFMDTLIKSGISCTMRKNRGDDIAAACGQLVARAKNETLNEKLET